MIPKIQRILYTTDLSQNSSHAFSYAKNFAKSFDAKIIILHVLEKMSPNTRLLLESYLDKVHSKETIEERVTHNTIERIKSGLKSFCDKELKDDPECADRVVSIEVSEGYPAEEILKKADDLYCDAIVMGTHGKGIISHTFLGSVAERVLRRVRKPIFIIPLPKGEKDITLYDI